MKIYPLSLSSVYLDEKTQSEKEREDINETSGQDIRCKPSDKLVKSWG